MSAVRRMQCAGCSLAGAQCAVRAGSWAEPWVERARRVRSRDVKVTVNGMSVNVAKSDLISVMNRFSKPLKVGNLESQSQIRLLGLTMTDKLSFMPHAVDVISKIAAKLPGIVRMRTWASDKLVKDTAQACLVSHMTYCMEVWAYERRVQVLL